LTWTIPHLQNEASRPILPIQADFLLPHHADSFASEIFTEAKFIIHNSAFLIPSHPTPPTPISSSDTPHTSGLPSLSAREGFPREILTVDFFRIKNEAQFIASETVETGVVGV
jgi:hypothetical protein